MPGDNKKLKEILDTEELNPTGLKIEDAYRLAGFTEFAVLNEDNTFSVVYLKAMQPIQEASDIAVI